MIKGYQPACCRKRESELDDAFIKCREKPGPQNEDHRKQADPLIPAQDTGLILQNGTEKETYRGRYAD
jgi:hypothetical protein